MTRYFIPGVDKDFIMTRSKYAQFLDITVNCLKLRMRRGFYGSEYVVDNGKYLFRFPKRNGDLHVTKPSNEPTNEPSQIHGPEVHVSSNASGHDTITTSLTTQIKAHVNRGATHAGKTNYRSNMSGCKKANDIKALNKIRNNLGDEFVLDNLDKQITIMHPGPINRGVELTSDVADSEHSIILNQVENGVAIRMAVLYLLSIKKN